MDSVRSQRGYSVPEAKKIKGLCAGLCENQTLIYNVQKVQHNEGKQFLYTVQHTAKQSRQNLVSKCIKISVWKQILCTLPCYADQVISSSRSTVLCNLHSVYQMQAGQIGNIILPLSCFCVQSRPANANVKEMNP